MPTIIERLPFSKSFTRPFFEKEKVITPNPNIWQSNNEKKDTEREFKDPLEYLKGDFLLPKGSKAFYKELGLLKKKEGKFPRVTPENFMWLLGIATPRVEIQPDKPWHINESVDIEHQEAEVKIRREIQESIFKQYEKDGTKIVVIRIVEFGDEYKKVSSGRKYELEVTSLIVAHLDQRNRELFELHIVLPAGTEKEDIIPLFIDETTPVENKDILILPSLEDAPQFQYAKKCYEGLLKETKNGNAKINIEQIKEGLEIINARNDKGNIRPGETEDRIINGHLCTKDWNGQWIPKFMLFDDLEGCKKWLVFEKQVVNGKNGDYEYKGGTISAATSNKDPDKKINEEITNYFRKNGDSVTMNIKEPPNWNPVDLNIEPQKTIEPLNHQKNEIGHDNLFIFTKSVPDSSVTEEPRIQPRIQYQDIIRSFNLPRFVSDPRSYIFLFPTLSKPVSVFFDNNPFPLRNEEEEVKHDSANNTYLSSDLPGNQTVEPKILESSRVIHLVEAQKPINQQTEGIVRIEETTKPSPIPPDGGGEEVIVFSDKSSTPIFGESKSNSNTDKQQIPSQQLTQSPKQESVPKYKINDKVDKNTLPASQFIEPKKSNSQSQTTESSVSEFNKEIRHENEIQETHTPSPDEVKAKTPTADKTVQPKVSSQQVITRQPLVSASESHQTEISETKGQKQPSEIIVENPAELVKATLPGNQHEADTKTQSKVVTPVIEQLYDVASPIILSPYLHQEAVSTNHQMQTILSISEQNTPENLKINLPPLFKTNDNRSYDNERSATETPRITFQTVPKKHKETVVLPTSKIKTPQIELPKVLRTQPMPIIIVADNPEQTNIKELQQYYTGKPSTQIKPIEISRNVPSVYPINYSHTTNIHRLNPFFVSKTETELKRKVLPKFKGVLTPPVILQQGNKTDLKQMELAKPKTHDKPKSQNQIRLVEPPHRLPYILHFRNQKSVRIHQTTSLKYEDDKIKIESLAQLNQKNLAQEPRLANPTTLVVSERKIPNAKKATMKKLQNPSKLNGIMPEITLGEPLILSSDVNLGNLQPDRSSTSPYKRPLRKRHNRKIDTIFKGAFNKQRITDEIKFPQEPVSIPALGEIVNLKKAAQKNSAQNFPGLWMLNLEGWSKEIYQKSLPITKDYASLSAMGLIFVVILNILVGRITLI